MNIQQALELGTQQIQIAIPTTSARLDCELLLAKTLNKNRTFLYTWPKQRLTKAQQYFFNNLLQKRSDGMPIAYILQEKDFWGMTFKVTPDTLIPRNDTETLIETIIKINSVINLKNKPIKVLDLGTGSGVIAITIKSIWKHFEVVATDISLKALEIAKINAEVLKNDVSFYHGNWYDALPKDLKNDLKNFDFICSNPPYISPNDIHLKQGDLRFEPISSLVAEKQGISDLEYIIKNSLDYLKPNGWIILEHGYNQAQDVRDLLNTEGFVDINTQLDLQGIPRVTYGKNKKA